MNPVRCELRFRTVCSWMVKYLLVVCQIVVITCLTTRFVKVKLQMLNMVLTRFCLFAAGLGRFQRVHS